MDEQLQNTNTINFEELHSESQRTEMNQNNNENQKDDSLMMAVNGQQR